MPLIEAVEKCRDQITYWAVMLDIEHGRGPYRKCNWSTAVRDAYGPPNTAYMAISLGTQIAPIRRAHFFFQLREAIQKTGGFRPGLFAYGPHTRELVQVGKWQEKYGFVTGVEWTEVPENATA